MRSILAPLGTIALAALSISPAVAAGAETGAARSVVVQAAAPSARTISLTTTSHVDYKPDLALLSFGARSDAATASEAANRTNALGNKIVSAVERLGIPARDIQTSQYDVAFNAAVPPVYAPSHDGRGRVVTQPGRAAYYEVSTTFNVKARVERAGDAIDAAVRAGSNSSYGLGFASSHIDDFYEQALSNAMLSARGRATALATAAGVTIDALQSITTAGAPSSEAPPAPIAAAQESRFASAPPVIAAGTQSVDASVDVVYTIK